MDKKFCVKKLSILVAIAVALFVPAPSFRTTTYAAPAAQEIETSPTGYTNSDAVDDTPNSAGIIANWGARGEDCLFLSDAAQAFYTGDYVFEVLSQKNGTVSISDVPSSDLYTALAKLMEDNHTFYTYYDGSKNVRDYYKYTDCVKKDTEQVSLFYRGTMETSAWNQGKIWNQEHVWPQSLLDIAGAGEEEVGDIMHLRAANSSENSARGNTPYGNGEEYYDPGPSVRGDCARTILYMYVRWGLTEYVWGVNGVIESVDVLLDWMAEDPVDTWEMGRNDAVESVTHTRNVFVDYPEYAWLLFGKEVPETVMTPSGTPSDSGLSAGGAVSSANSAEIEESCKDYDGDGSKGDWFRVAFVVIVIVSAMVLYAIFVDKKHKIAGKKRKRKKTTRKKRKK